jgi:hypothetical protein
VGNAAFRHLIIHRGGLAVDGLDKILLPPVTSDLLPEIAFRIHAADSDQRKA